MKNENGKRKNYIFYSYDPMIYVSDAHPIEVIEDWKKIDKLPFGYYNISNQTVTYEENEGKNSKGKSNIYCGI